MPSEAIANLDLTRRRLRTESARARTADPRRAVDCMTTVIARVPGWFTVAQARRVGELKGVAHLLIDDKAGPSGIAALATLAAVPATDLVARWTVRTPVSVDADATVELTRSLLCAEGAACLPVTSGGVLVGTISRSDIELHADHVPHAA